MADWVGQTARLLRPLVEVVGTHVMSAGRVHADDTTVPVLSPGNGKTKTGRLWCYARDDQPFGGKTPRAVLYCYSPDRKGEHPKKHLAAFKGILQADGYAGYAGLYQQGVTEAACMAHGLGDGSVGGDRVDGHQRAARTAAFRQPCQKNRNGGQRVGFARHRLLTEHEARCGGEGGDHMERCPPVALSWLRLDVLPSMATKSGRSGQVSRAQLANAAWNKAGSIRFINMISQRPPGTPLAKGR